jgi:hypothetical protein
MGDMITWLEATRVSTVMRDTTWVWPLFESLHFLGLAMVIGGAGYFDLRLLGLFRSVPVSAVKAFMPAAIAGFVINLATGVAFFVMAPGMYALSAIWWVKVFFIIVAGLNAMLFETTLGTRVLALGPNEDTPASFKMVGAVSLLSWFAVLYCGRMLPYLGTGN